MHIYKPKEFADMIGVSVITLQRWDNKGRLKAHRTPTNRRYYTDNELEIVGIPVPKEYYQTILKGIGISFVPIRDSKGTLVLMSGIPNTNGQTIRIKGIESPTETATVAIFENSDTHKELCKYEGILHEHLCESVSSIIKRVQDEFRFR